MAKRKFVLVLDDEEDSDLIEFLERMKRESHLSYQKTLLSALLFFYRNPQNVLLSFQKMIDIVNRVSRKNFVDLSD